MAPRRRQWSSLSAAQQRRYLAAGASGHLVSGRALNRRQVRDYYNRGASLKAARGHATRERPKRVPPPREPLARLLAGEADTKDLRALERWQREDVPPWLRDSRTFGPDTAAALARVPLLARNWTRVEMFTRRDGTVDAYVISQRGRTYKTTFPDTTSALEFADFVRMQKIREAHGALDEDSLPIDDVIWETP